MPPLIPIADPSLDIRDDVAAKSDIFEFTDKIWFQKTAAAVIDAGRCTRCGSCIAACPSGSIGIGTDNLPTLVRMCTGCSSCWDYCPLGGLSVPRLHKVWSEEEAAKNASFISVDDLTSPAADGATPAEPAGTEEASSTPTNTGLVFKAYVARARKREDGTQDGGVVTAILAELLRTGYLDGALVNRKVDALHGKVMLAKSADDVVKGAGSVYDQTFTLAALQDPLPKGIESIAMVGTPCQISGLRALQRYPWRYRAAPVKKVKLAIALFCTRSFDPDKLTDALKSNGVDIDAAAKVDIRDGMFRVFNNEGGTLFESRARDMRDTTLKGCDECADFTGAVADIAVGNAGSEAGYTTVLIRTQAGAEAWAAAAAAVEAREMETLEAVDAQSGRNRRLATRATGEGMWDDGSMWLTYGDYLAAREGSARAATEVPTFRAHHYTVAC